MNDDKKIAVERFNDVSSCRLTTNHKYPAVNATTELAEISSERRRKDTRRRVTFDNRKRKRENPSATRVRLVTLIFVHLACLLYR